jgi:hypothetical protein
MVPGQGCSSPARGTFGLLRIGTSPHRRAARASVLSKRDLCPLRHTGSHVSLE